MQDVRIFKPERFGDRLACLAAEPTTTGRIYSRGDVDALDAPCVAVVGARACSAYGAEVARMLGRELAAAGVTVVSGLARGVDRVEVPTA